MDGEKISREAAAAAAFESMPMPSGTTSSIASQQQRQPLQPQPAPVRTIRVERMVRLPVWPVWAGVIDFFVGWIFGPQAGSKLEQYVLGGRVCPMQFDGTKTSPFLLLVHHHHNFWKWDAIFRKLSAFVLPEGFPAHPHRGFTTLTYFLPPDTEGGNANANANAGGGGGFVHRDSIGVKQTYGSKGSYKNQAQWLFTGRGMLHEEMFDFLQNDLGKKDKQDYNSRYELYQLWVNVPGTHKLDPPRVQLLREADGKSKDETRADEDVGVMPRVVSSKTSVSPANGEDKLMTTTTDCEVVVIAGSYQPSCEDDRQVVSSFQSQAEPLHSDLSVLHVTITETETATTATSSTTSSPGWTYDVPPGHDTLIVYVRKGSCTMQTTATISSTAGNVISSSSSSSSTDVPIHSTVFVEIENNDRASFTTTTREQLIVRPNELDDPVDLLVLSGRPLYTNDDNTNYFNEIESVAMQGSMVMNNNAQIQQAYMDYQYGQMGQPWDHTLNDEEWMEHVRNTKPPM
jgi:redox-sensitive bicupin YhaK (pirin superfamily)